MFAAAGTLPHFLISSGSDGEYLPSPLLLTARIPAASARCQSRQSLRREATPADESHGCPDGTRRLHLHALDELREAGELLGHKLLGGLVLEFQCLFVELGGRLADEDFRRSE